MGLDVFWDWEKSRTPEGYYQVRGGIDYAIAKSMAVAPFCDIIWMETKTAKLEDAKKFAKAIHKVYPEKMLAYNLSPSFNWDTTGMNDEEMQKIDTDNIRRKLVSKMKKANNKFKACPGEEIYNFVFLSCDSKIFLSKETLQEVLYGSETVISYQNKHGDIKFKEILQDNGIWSKTVYMNIDIIFFVKAGTDFLGDDFDPYVFPNPHKIEKLKKMPEPFRSMKMHLPPTMLGQSIYGF